MKKTVLILSMLVLSSLVYGDVESIDSLKGIKEVVILIEAFTPEQIRYGLNPIQIADWISVELAKYDFKPLPGDKLPDFPNTPAIYVTRNPAHQIERVGVPLVMKAIGRRLQQNQGGRL